MLLLMNDYSTIRVDPHVAVLFQHGYWHQERFSWNDMSDKRSITLLWRRENLKKLIVVMRTFIFKTARKPRYHSEISLLVLCQTIFLKYKTDFSTQNSETLDPERKIPTPIKTKSYTVTPVKEIATFLRRSECSCKPSDRVMYEEIIYYFS